ncbi:MAG: amidohydrolase family protein [Bdellovibrionia bacterium]
MLYEIKRPYDSHVHLLGTGERLVNWSLFTLTQVEQLRDYSHLQSSQRGDVVVGFGLQSKLFLDDKQLSALDEIFDSTPIFFSSADGHGSWINAITAKMFGLGQKALRLQEDAHFNLLKQLPQYTDEQLQLRLTSAKKYFQERGFVFLRDMTSSLSEVKVWSEILQRDQDAHIEYFFPVFNMQDLPEVLINLRQAEKFSSRWLKQRGLKVFIDGTLGSQTAHSCQCSKGSSFFSLDEINRIIEIAWTNNLEVAFHCIGELAVELVVESARSVMNSGITGRLHLEHCEVLKSDTLKKLKSLHVTVHMQPSHALDDLSKLRAMSDLMIFPIKQLKNSQVPLFFGSDSPVVEPSFKSSFQGIESLYKMPKSQKLEWVLAHHSLEDGSLPDAKVVLDDNWQVQFLSFDGKILIDKSKS